MRLGKKSTVAKWLPVMVLAFCVGGMLSTSNVAGVETSVQAPVPEALGPFLGDSAVGAVATPSTFPEIDISQVVEEVKKVPIGYEVDLETLEFLKANPPLLPSFGPIHVNDLSDLIEKPQPNAPSLPTNFQGITYTGLIPPDNGTAAGPNHVVEMVNSSWRAFTKTGTAATVLIPFCGSGGWWSSVLPSGVTHCFDPKILYDQFSGRWVMLAVAQRESPQGSWYLLATSWTSDPTGNWCIWALDATLDGSNPTSNWADYPGLGVDNQAIYITSNQFTFSNDVFKYSKLRILDKRQLYNNTCGRVRWRDFWNLKNTDGSQAFTVQPAHTFGTPGVEYLINSNSTSGSSVTLWSLINPLTSPRLTRVSVRVGSYRLPPHADQCGGATPIHTGDARLLNAVYRNGSLWTAHTIACPSDSSKACLRLIRIAPRGPTVLDDFAFGNPPAGFYYYYPAVMTDGSDNVYVVFNRSSSSECVGIRYTGRLSSEPPNTLQGSAELKGGLGSYVRSDDRDRNRWGDYSGIAPDPVDTRSVWIAGEYVSATNTWATWIGRLTLP